MIKKIDFDGLSAVEIRTSKITAILIYEIGPRIAFFGKAEGENLLYWEKDGMQRGQWKLYGGHRVWITRPGADESEDTYIPDNELCSLSITGNTIIAISPANQLNQLERGMELEVLAEDCIKVRNFVINRGTLIYSGGVWSPTCVNPADKKIVIPLGNDESTWDVVKMAIPRVFAGNTTMLEDDQVSFCGNDLVVVPKGRVMKRVCSAPKGRIRLECGDYAFEKHSPYNRLLRYPFEGCNTAVFVGKDNFMAELETYGGESDIIPGAMIENIEFWNITQSTTSP
jgi:hypothetical protein